MSEVPEASKVTCKCGAVSRIGIRHDVATPSRGLVFPCRVCNAALTHVLAAGTAVSSLDIDFPRMPFVVLRCFMCGEEAIEIPRAADLRRQDCPKGCGPMILVEDIP